MSNLNNLTSKILKDAEETKNQILVEAKNDGDKIISKSIKKAESLKNEILEKAKSESESKYSRLISSAKLKVRNDQLRAKQDVISSIFLKAIDELNNLSNEQYADYVKKTLSELNLDGTETIIINERDKDVFNIKFLTDLNKNLMANGKKGEISLRTDGNFKSGFILDRNGIQVNNTFESLVNSLKSELEFEVTKALFG